MQDKYYYPIEEQINNCFKFLNEQSKDASDMDENELCDAEKKLNGVFCWVPHPDYIQSIPKHIATGNLIEP